MKENIELHTIESAPPNSKEALQEVQGAYGFIPNLMAVMAGSPAVIKGYKTLSAIYDSTSFTPTERQIVLLATSFENGCDYCMAAHTTIANMQKVDGEIIESLRKGTPILDDKLEALRLFTVEVAREKGWPSASATQRFLSASYTPSAMLEVVLGVGLKTISNYINHIANTPLDKAFEAAAWEKPSCGASQCGCSH